ncbi:MAG: hypothetical protein NVSMB39_3430 [Candidatus Saccharimonadales bacterium]
MDLKTSTPTKTGTSNTRTIQFVPPSPHTLYRRFHKVNDAKLVSKNKGLPYKAAVKLEAHTIHTGYTDVRDLHLSREECDQVIRRLQVMLDDKTKKHGPAYDLTIVQGYGVRLKATEDPATRACRLVTQFTLTVA